MKRLLIVALLFLIVLFSAYNSFGEESSSGQEAGEELIDEEVAAAKEVLEANLQYSEAEDMEQYLQTIASHGHEATRAEMNQFFQDYTVSHELTAFEVVERHDDEIVVKTSQIIKDQNQEGDKRYKSHKAEMMHVLKKEDNQWKIFESNVMDVQFIE